ncbi:hypothetical protein H0H81_004278 [Sphagnurus paluster]|uniref:Uncharacterized protein n=1 Tax=Sphagnurus paluster TaxID=117069 RepID=A0A9P7K3J0_9AGAR|nr:hypothetical protein H0H81_004278 [Sphagnurus paluster]
MPLLTGAEGKQLRKPRACKGVLGPETGRPETSREFAACMKNHFVLRGLREQKEGENGERQTEHTEEHGADVQSARETALTAVGDNVNTSNLSAVSNQGSDDTLPNKVALDALNEASLTEVVSGGREGIDLLGSVRNKYKEDPFFKIVLEKPKDYKNFEVTKEGLIYINLNGHLSNLQAK